MGGRVLLCGAAASLTLLTALWPIACVSARAVQLSAPRPYLFDPGDSGSTLEPGNIRLTPTDSYTRARGFGWTDGPLQPYARPELSRSRSSRTIDGVEARAIGFRADVPAGVWWLTLWIDAGTEDASTLAVTVNEAPSGLAWQSFLPPAEPRQGLQKAFRLMHRRVAVGDAGLSFRLTGGADSVRLLAFSLWPDPVPATADHKKLMAALRSAGQYPASSPLTALRTDIDRLARDSNDAFTGYWREQLALLDLAEQDIAMAGWQRSTDRTGLGIFDRFHQAVMILDGVLDRPDADRYPLFERALWQRGRVLYWLALERHGAAERAGAARDLATLFARHQDDSLLAMYNGRKIDLPDRCDELETPATAPPWSVAQREALCRLGQLARYWTEDRQAPNGEFGGKLDDDVELLRWWTPLLLVGDPAAIKGWKRLADGVWNGGWLEEGYDKRVVDVEHGSELLADTAPALAVLTDEGGYLDRLRPSARHFADLWTARTMSGRRFFRSAWFSSRELDVRPPRDRDVEMNTRAVKAVRYLAWKTRDPILVRTLHEWATAWVHAALRTDKGKPAGLIPASVRFSDEAINGDEPTWHRAQMFWDYYDWSGGAMMLDHQLFVYLLTGDRELLRPLLAALDLVERHGTRPGIEQAAPARDGTPRWAATVLAGDARFWSVVEQWRLLTGDARYDALRTTEALHTDRVYVAPEKSLGADHIKAMLTGDGTRGSPSPYYAVTWADADPTFTGLVSDAGRDRLSVRVYSHATTNREVRMRPWQLAPGRYLLTRRTPGDRTRETIELRSAGGAIALTVPPRTLVEVALTVRARDE